MTVLSYSYGIIIDHAFNAPGHGKNFVGVLNATYKRYLKVEMELIGKLGSNNTTKIIILPRVSKDVSIKFTDLYPHILNNKEILNGLKGSTKMQEIESVFKYQSSI